MYSFEFDPGKSESNQNKHGIDFVQARLSHNFLILLKLCQSHHDEPRALVVGRIGGKHWSAIITYRAGRIRIISVRRSRDSEVALYES